MSMPPPPHHPPQPTGPQAPPPSYPLGPPHGYGPPVGQPTQAMPASRPPASKAIQLVWTLGLISVAGVVLGLSLNENGANQWHSVKAWGGLAILGAALTLLPAVGGSLGVRPQRAWQAAVCGAAALVLFWVLFTLPAVGSNVSLLTTIGVAAGIICAWVAPGREQRPGPPPGPSW